MPGTSTLIPPARRLLTLLALWLALLLLAAGGGTTPAAAPPPTAPVEPAATGLIPEAPAAASEPAATLPPAAAEPTEAPPLAPAPVAIEVTTFTPSQQEGPYYPVDKPADRDNDLVAVAGAAGLPAGQVIEFGGVVYDAAGLPVPGAVVEIWQTDANGVYLHPRDPGFAGRDPNFQGYGEAVAGADGRYTFRTIVPGLYEPRPRHIHVKVRLDGQELLTTQFYFADEIALRGDDAAMLLTTTSATDAAGNAILRAERDIVLRQSLAGN